MKPAFNLIEKFEAGTSFFAGDTIFAEGDAGSLMYAVAAGEVEIRSGKKVLEVVDKGGVFGEMSLIDGSPRSATAIAKTDCQLVPIDERRFTFMAQQTPFFALEVMRLMAARLRKANQER